MFDLILLERTLVSVACSRRVRVRMAVPLGLVAEALRGRRMGGAVLWGLVGGVSSGWRCAIWIGGEGVAWMALWRGRRRMDGAVPMRLA